MKTNNYKRKWRKIKYVVKNKRTRGRESCKKLGNANYKSKRKENNKNNKETVESKKKEDRQKKPKRDSVNN